MRLIKTMTMIVSRSRTTHPQSTTLNLDRTVLKESYNLVILGVTFHAKITFENQSFWFILSCSSEDW